MMSFKNPLRRIFFVPVNFTGMISDSIAKQTFMAQVFEREHAIGFVKRFRTLSERYRNRRKRFDLRFNLNCRNL
jgi:hypothetical protein